MPPAPGGRGNFQSVKLQRPDRVAVCSHSARDTTAHMKLILYLMPAEPGLATHH
jgi:hypothetical protein